MAQEWVFISRIGFRFCKNSRSRSLSLRLSRRYTDTRQGTCNLGSFITDIQFKTQGITNVGGAKVHKVTWVLGKGFRGLGKGFMWSGAEDFGGLRLLSYKFCRST
ncbi:hypothetical protein MPER_01011 [Moniliophthora perniciosa FA553]|nr:hypothetical protein MPER_01011 [Moniliophthora perniciosa FA553]